MDPEAAMESVKILCARAATVGEGVDTVEILTVARCFLSLATRPL